MPTVLTTDPASAHLARLAVDSLLAELRLYPKPGLVSPVDSGAHRDMDFALMEKSARCLEPYFARLAVAGREGEGFQQSIVPIGLEAERHMLTTTGGVNTHRGALFIHGLLVAAAARCPAPITAHTLQSTLCQTWGAELRAHLVSGMQADSHGGIVHRRTGRGGAREEAADGFPGIFKIALPHFEKLLAGGIPADDAAIDTLFVLIGETHDTNLYHRADTDGACAAREAARDFLKSGGVRASGWPERAIEIHHRFVVQSLSPGGAADLLAATLFAHRLTQPSGAR